MAREKMWVAIYEAEKGSGEASYMVRVLKRAGIRAETGHSPYFGYTAVIVKIIPSKAQLEKIRKIVKRETLDDIDVDLIWSNIQRGLAT